MHERSNSEIPFLHIISIDILIHFDYFLFQFNLVCDKDSFSNLAQSIFFAGVLCGDLLFGAIADR